MAVQMPTAVQLEQAFGAKGATGATKSAHEELREEERRGRLMRENQIQDNSSVQAEFNATFPSGSDRTVSDWGDFGRIQFTKKPAFAPGSERVAMEGENPPLNEDASNFDPLVHFAVPCTSQVLRWRQNDKGYYTGAKLLVWAEGAVPENFKVTMFATFTGPALRRAG